MRQQQQRQWDTAGAAAASVGHFRSIAAFVEMFPKGNSSNVGVSAQGQEQQQCKFVTSGSEGRAAAVSVGHCQHQHQS